VSDQLRLRGFEKVDYQKIASTAENLIKKFGTKAILRTPTGDSVYNPATDENVTIYDEYPGICVVGSFEQVVIDGTLILATDKRLTCKFPASPKPSQSLIDIYNKQGEKVETYLVVNVDTVSPDATVTLVFKAQGRKM
jgi:hypothetical protein